YSRLWLRLPHRQSRYFPVWKWALVVDVPPATPPAPKPWDRFIDGHGDGARLSTDHPTPAFGPALMYEPGDWRIAAQQAPRDDVQPLSWPDGRLGPAVAHPPAPFGAGGRIAGRVALGNPVPPEMLRAGDDEISHPCAPVLRMDHIGVAR